MTDEITAKQPNTEETTHATTTDTTPDTTTDTTTASDATDQQKTTISDEQASSLKESISADLSAKVGEEVSKSVIAKIGDALGLTKKQEEALPTDPKDLQKIIDQKVEEKFKNISTEASEHEKQEKEDRQKRIDGIVTGWYSQYNQMARLGKVPAISKQDDPNDKGVVVRRKIITAIGKMIDKNKSEGVEYTPSVADVLVSIPNILSAPPGADLPIGGNTSNNDDSTKFSHNEIHGGSFESIARG